MKFKAVLFDMDGTLVPMDQDEFVRCYFKELAKILCPLGVETDLLVKSIWAGTAAMVKNDGTVTNDVRFWDTFIPLTGLDYDKARPAADAFYGNEFNRAKSVARANPLARKAVEVAGRDGRKVVLATNSIFPMVGQISRLGWVDLRPEDFEFITAYETDRFAKPNPSYYTDICRRLDVQPEECIMIGNDETEDMFPAAGLGMTCYHVTDFPIYDKSRRWDGPSGSFEDMVGWLEKV
jgi:FMN phosphatase YigB (HAD superfamily)